MEILQNQTQSNLTVTTSEHAETVSETKDLSRKFSLKFGYQDKNDAELIHKDVIIGRRPTAKDVIAISETDSETQAQMEMVVSSITSFGSLPMPTPLTTLLSLNAIDRYRLMNEFIVFSHNSKKGRETKIFEDNRVKLAFPIIKNGITYDVVRFGNLLTGFDEVAVENDEYNTKQKIAVKIGREITELSTSDNSQSITTSLTLAEIEAMDAFDYTNLREAESIWLNSFLD